MPSPLQPEFFTLLGINLFLALSLAACLLDKHFPTALPYLYQVAALAGFGNLLVSRGFLDSFGGYMRFWYSLMYLVVALANIISVNAYLGIVKKLLNYAKVYMVTVTFPTLLFTFFFLSNYAGIALHPLIILPTFSWQATFIGIVAFDTLVVGLGAYIFFKPKPWYLILGAGAIIAGASIYALFRPSWGAAVFVTSAIGLTIACVIILGISIYILAKIWLDALKERKIRGR